MKKLFSLLLGLLIINSGLPINAQELIRNSSVTGVCYAGKKINRIYIPKKITPQVAASGAGAAAEVDS